MVAEEHVVVTTTVKMVTSATKVTAEIHHVPMSQVVIVQQQEEQTQVQTPIKIQGQTHRQPKNQKQLLRLVPPHKLLP
jgi:hypothetical protein